MKKFESICWISNVFISKSILTPKDNSFELPLRCGIAFGKAIIDNGIHLGKPFIDAYLLSEHQEWMGGAIHPSVETKYVTPNIDYNRDIVKYDVPIKSKKCDEKQYDIISKYALNWVTHHPSLKPWINDALRPGPTLKDIGGHVQRHKWNDNNKLKEKNTLEFILRIDKMWNEAYDVDKSTIENFKCEYF